ncbi:MAG TPA: sigma-54 dependent transcriptional regulator [Pirellulales bacterium]|nr:sigma-54 dependent transcriptional regulator [Pirellulales bacterium]
MTAVLASAAKLTLPSDPVLDLSGFCANVPHQALHGQTRSFLTFTPAMFNLLDELPVAAAHAVTLLLVGETGSGKTFLARLIHELSPVRDERCLTVACGALPPDLIESELFGYVKGAFTGADRDKPGKFAAAGGGTLLLDEIDVLPMEQQAKLLRVIETGEFEPVGSNETLHSRARLIVASHRELEELVAAGAFRKDLYYRLNILKFNLLPLRERPLDVEFLARHFIVQHSRTHGIELRRIDADAIEALRHYAWPGNVRELENVVRRAVLYCRGGVVALGDLPGAIRQHVPQGAPAKLNLESPAAAGATLEARIDSAERRIISETLCRNGNSRIATSRELGISRVTLYNKMKKLGLHAELAAPPAVCAL